MPTQVFNQTSAATRSDRQSAPLDLVPAAPIRAAAPHEAAAAIDVVTLAFSTDPVLRWIYPDPSHYLAHMPQMVRAFAGSAFPRGTAYCVEGFLGAALWLPPGAHPDEEAMAALLQSSTPEYRHAEFWAVMEQMGRFHPQVPHWYLPLIGVDPAYHGQGLGSALMRHALHVCDQQGLPAYLESSNPRNIPLYLRLGFEAIGTIQHGSSPSIVPMLRPAR